MALELQARGHDVVGIDPSPGALEVCRQRGVRDARRMRLEDVDTTLGRFGTIVFYGNNFGLFGARGKARQLLTNLRDLADRIVATSNDPYMTEDPIHLAYHERNRQRHRMGGQVRIRTHPLPQPGRSVVRLPARVPLGDGATGGWDRVARPSAHPR